jgi:hypothetical protein
VGRDLLLVAHILLLVSWLGIDVGVFYSSFVMRRPGLSTDARTQVRHVMTTLDLAPRISLILMAPVGLGLAYLTKFGFFEYDETAMESLLWAFAAVAIAWAIATAVVFFRRPDRPDSRAIGLFDRFDWYARVVVAAGFLVLGIWSLTGDGPLAPDWLSWKATLFGLIVLAGLWIRLAAKQYRPALLDLLDNGESEERLARVNQTIRGVYPAVLTVWAGVVAMVFISIIRP